ncbi:MAG: NTP transferase domain-containing protein [Ramlibacter sp.]|nr:NTP transferase domain-containing protein [Ramlibacter sp.]
MRQPVVLVLASGRGERFRASGGTTHKLQALLAGKPVLQHTLEAVRASGLPWHLEDAGHPGMGDSIAAAVRATAAAPGWLVLPADLPLIQSATLQAVAAALEGREVVVPVHEGARGHPVGFAAVCAPQLLELQGDRGAALVLRSHDAIELIVDDVGAVTDVDTLDALAVAEQLHARRIAGSAADRQPSAG